MDAQEFEAMFVNEYLPGIVSRYEADGKRDGPARREAWNDLIDSMVKDNVLPLHAMDWSLPDHLDN